MTSYDPLLHRTRRHFFGDCAVGLGAMALSSLLKEGAAPEALSAGPLSPKKGHFPAKAKNVIFLFMAGGPSQLELFDHKPALNRLDGEPIPDSYLRDRRFAFMNTFTNPRLLAARRSFSRHGQSGALVSELLPHIGSVADD